MAHAANGMTRVWPSTPSGLPPELRDAWQWHCDHERAFDSPFHRVEYAEAAEAAGLDVRVAVIERGSDRPVFFPYQRDRRNVAHPIGLRACDASGLVGVIGPGWSPAWLLEQCGLRGWRFANVVAGDPALQPYVTSTARAPYIDLTGGFDAFCQQRQAAGSDLVPGTRRKARRCEQEAGALRLDVQSFDAHALDRLLAWKGEQRDRTLTVDVLRSRSMRTMLGLLHRIDTPWFAGLLTVLYAGDRVAAAHFGLRGRHSWHYWFASFDPALGRHSPGLVLLLEMCRAAPALGIDRITLGHGDEAYKLRFAGGETSFVRGDVNGGLGSRIARRVWRQTRTLAETSPATALVVRSMRRARRAVFHLTGE